VKSPLVNVSVAANECSVRPLGSALALQNNRLFIIAQSFVLRLKWIPPAHRSCQENSWSAHRAFSNQ